MTSIRCEDVEMKNESPMENIYTPVITNWAREMKKIHGVKLSTQLVIQ